MNNNDLFKRIHNEAENVAPSDKINPDNIENLLDGVSRKRNNKAIISCIAVLLMSIGVFTVFFGNNPLKPQKIETYEGTDNSYVNNESIENYNEIYKVIKKISKNIMNEYYMNKLEYSDTGFNTTSSSNYYSTKYSDNYSQTNVQVSGIDEADVVKTDGKYIFAVNDSTVNIIESENGKTRLISKVKINSKIDNIYVNNKKLIAISTEYIKGNEATPDALSCYASPTTGNAVTKIYIYNLENIKSPLKESVLTQSGECISSRMINNVIYTISHKAFNYEDYKSIDKNNPFTYCPTYSNKNGLKCIDSKSIIINKEIEGVEFLTISSINLKNTENFADISSVLGGGTDIYASYKNIYVSSNSYDYNINCEQTRIYRFSINGAQIKEKGVIKLKGYLLDQFSMDENKRYFRVVTERYINNENSAVLSIYNKKLKLIGQVVRPVGNEIIKSVRFDNDIAYFVTFENTDPLFCVDISNPKKPEILSELKISGFSEYLHPFKNDLLIGLGKEADPTTGNENGLKLSMFDVSDKKDIKEISKYVFSKFKTKGDFEDIDYYDSFSTSEAEHNHKAIYVDSEKGIIGIPYIKYTETFYTETGELYYALFKYDDLSKKFVQVKNILLKMEKTGNFNNNLDYTRGIRIGEYFYVVTNKEVKSYSYDTFETVNSGKLKLINN